MERTALPDHLIKGVSGKTVFQAEHQQVGTIVIVLYVYHPCIDPTGCSFGNVL